MIGIEQFVIAERPTPLTILQQLDALNVSIVTKAGEPLIFTYPQTTEVVMTSFLVPLHAQCNQCKMLKSFCATQMRLSTWFKCALHRLHFYSCDFYLCVSALYFRYRTSTKGLMATYAHCTHPTTLTMNLLYLRKRWKYLEKRGRQPTYSAAGMIEYETDFYDV